MSSRRKYGNLILMNLLASNSDQDQSTETIVEGIAQQALIDNHCYLSLHKGVQPWVDGSHVVRHVLPSSPRDHFL